MNWGYKILIVYLAFVAGIALMVYKSTTQKIDLVTTDYYAKELKYQDKIDEMKRVSALSAPVKYQLKDNKVIIDFPKDFNGKKLTGEALLYCPSDENRDIRQTFSILDEPLKMKVPVTKSGLYQLQLSWQDGKTSYYFENKIFLK